MITRLGLVSIYRLSKNITRSRAAHIKIVIQSSITSPFELIPNQSLQRLIQTINEK